MAHFEGIPLFGSQNEYNSGLILELAKPPKKEHSIPYKDALIQLSPETSHIVCSFNDTSNYESTLEKGSKLIEECLDLLSVIRGIDLIAKNASWKAYVWWLQNEEQVLHVECSFLHNLNYEMTFEIESRDSEGNIIPPVEIEPEYHAALRFFRLSQVTDDLYDAYRNMYLSFELILSAFNPLGNGEREGAWIRRVLGELDSDMDLLHQIGLPDSSIAYLFKTIYKDARCNLFHAKSGKKYFLPTSDIGERKKIAKALTYLSRCVLILFSKHCNLTRARGLMLASSVYESCLDAMLEGVDLVLSDISDTKIIGHPPFKNQFHTGKEV